MTASRLTIGRARRVLRVLHRDLGYFFAGLLIAYSVSGMALNHRTQWDPREYVVESRPVSTGLVSADREVSQKVIADTLGRLVSEARVEHSFVSDEGELRVFSDGLRLAIDLSTGDGELEETKARPVLQPMVYLHQTTEESWIWFADVFGVAMLLIVFSGLLMLRGPKGLRWRGLAFGAAGLVFPFVFLFLLT